MKEKTCAEIIAESQDRINNSPVLKAACTYSDSVKKPATIYGYGKLGLIEAFQAGAEWQSIQSPWIRTEDKMPEDNELVLTSSSIYGTKLLVWNDFHKVWDDEDGDDTYCERDKIDAWMPIPE